MPRLVPRLGCIVLAAATVASSAAETEFVTVSGDALRAGDRPCAFACAAGIRLPEPDATAGTNALDEARAAARLLARDLALAGFNMVRLPDLAVPRAGDPATEARLAVQDEFVAACKDEGVHVWAEVLHPVLDFAPVPADADALDDPATREAWREAVADTNFPAASLLLAAPWDPRLEILVQRRLRDWARAFNPRTGLRRCDDPAYALFSFSTLWWEDLDADALPELPPFLARGLADAWNDWLYERYGTDLALRGRFPLESGESLAEGTVAFPPPERSPDSARTREQRAFLHRLSTDHLSRLLAPFSAFGQTSRTGVAVSDLTGTMAGETLTIHEWNAERLAHRNTDELAAAHNGITDGGIVAAQRLHRTVNLGKIERLKPADQHIGMRFFRSHPADAELALAQQLHLKFILFGLTRLVKERTVNIELLKWLHFILNAERCRQFGAKRRLDAARVNNQIAVNGAHLRLNANHTVAQQNRRFDFAAKHKAHAGVLRVGDQMVIDGLALHLDFKLFRIGMLLQLDGFPRADECHILLQTKLIGRRQIHFGC